jgi:hypothetical protein
LSDFVLSAAEFLGPRCLLLFFDPLAMILIAVQGF